MMLDTRPRSARLTLLATVLTLFTAACGSSSGTPSTGSSAPETGAPASGAASAPASGEPSTETPSEEPTEAPPSESPSTGPSESPPGSPDTGPAAACTGTDDNRTFFADAAASVDWTVVCAVLPARWSVTTGSYRSARGGRLEIGYKGPNGATIQLNEGSWCTDPATCVPAGSEIGTARLGPMDGTMLRLDAGGFAVVVDRGETVSWMFQTSGIGKTKSAELAAAAAVVGD
jgi:hypothetical protein